MRDIVATVMMLVGIAGVVVSAVAVAGWWGGALAVSVLAVVGGWIAGFPDEVDR